MAQCPSAWYSINITEIKFFTAAARHAGDIDKYRDMNQERKPAGLILAAGFSSRMKDFKPLMKIGRHNPLEILIRHFKKAGVDDILW